MDALADEAPLVTPGEIGGGAGVAIGVGIDSLSDGAGTIEAGDFFGDFFSFDFTGGFGVGSKGGGVVLVFGFEMLLAGLVGGDDIAGIFLVKEDAFNFEFLGFEGAFFLFDGLSGVGDLGLGGVGAGLFFGKVAEGVATGKDSNGIFFFGEVEIDEHFGEGGLLGF